MKCSCCVLYLCLCLCHSQAAETVRVALVHYPPFTNQHTSDQGFIPQVFQRIMERSPFQLEIKFYPYARTLDMTYRSKVDLISFSNIAENQRLRDSLHAGVALFSVQHNTFLYDSRIYPQGLHWKSFAEIRDKKIGTIIQFPTIPSLRREGLNITTQTSQVGLMKQLFMGRIDLWAVADMTGSYLLRKHFPEQAAFIKRAEGPVSCCNQVYFGINKNYIAAEELTQLIHTRYTQLLNNGWAKQRAEAFYGKNNVPAYFLPKPDQMAIRYYSATSE